MPVTSPAGMLLPVPKFSKFLHGAALLFQHRCLNVPYWFLPGECPVLVASPSLSPVRLTCCPDLSCIGSWSMPGNGVYSGPNRTGFHYHACPAADCGPQTRTTPG